MHVFAFASEVVSALAQAAIDGPSANGPAWIQAGGVALFAGAVWWELRQQRSERRESEKMINATIEKMSQALTAMLERDRFRDTGPIRVPRLPTE